MKNSLPAIAGILAFLAFAAYMYLAVQASDPNILHILKGAF